MSSRRLVNGDAFFHGCGHHLGLEVHDITPEGAIPENAVITIEPGIYVPDGRRSACASKTTFS
jgi:Xaa-Pro aminopeptidase